MGKRISMVSKEEIVDHLQNAMATCNAEIEAKANFSSTVEAAVVLYLKGRLNGLLDALNIVRGI